MGKVSGTVQYQGKPLDKAIVVFHPDTPGRLPGSGMTDATGHYSLQTIKPGDGAIVGKYRVTIEAHGPDKPLPPSESTTGLPGANTMPGDRLIPEKYFMPDKSGLEAEVKSGSNTFDFDLKP